MPRFWFTAKDEATLIQVQKNAFCSTGGYARKTILDLKMSSRLSGSIAPLSFSS